MSDESADTTFLSVDDIIDEFDVTSVQTDENKTSKMTKNEEDAHGTYSPDNEHTLTCTNTRFNGTNPSGDKQVRNQAFERVSTNKSQNGKSTVNHASKRTTKSEDGEHTLNHAFKHSNDTSDMRLIVEGKPLYVSKVVLSLVSPVLKRLFSIHNSDGQVEMALPGKKYDDIVEFLYCVYPDSLSPVTEDTVETMLDLAYEYQVTTLIVKCEQFLIQSIEKTTPKPDPNQIVHYLNISDKYGLDDLQKATYETAAKTESELLENVPEFWDLPSVTTTSVFIRRLKILEKCSKSIKTKIKEIQNHCALYHKGERHANASVCSKCYANIGRQTHMEIKLI